MYLSFRLAKLLCHSVWSSCGANTAQRHLKIVLYDEYSMGGSFDSSIRNTEGDEVYTNVYTFVIVAVHAVIGCFHGCYFI